MSETIFAKIVNKEIPADIVNPQAPTHILIIPKKPIAKLAEANHEDQALLGHLLLIAKDIAAELGFQDAYRLTINNGSGAGQTVFHLHIHLLAGRPFSWPPG